VSHQPTRAVVDLGTNSVVLLVARRVESGWTPLVQTAEVTRLGRGLGLRRTLDPAACADTLVVLQRFARLCQPFAPESVEVVGTCVLRELVDECGFCQRVEELFGTAPRILSPAEEGELGFVGGMTGLDLAGTVLLVDLGGGSTELVLGEVHHNLVRVNRVTSLPLGCLRHQLAEGASGSEREKLRAVVRAQVATIGVLPTVDHVVGVGGTITALVALHERVVFDAVALHGRVLTREDFGSLLTELDAGKDGKATQLVDPKRWPRLPTGAVIAEELLAALGCSKLVVSTAGLRFGVLNLRDA